MVTTEGDAVGLNDVGKCEGKFEVSLVGVLDGIIVIGLLDGVLVGFEELGDNDELFVGSRVRLGDGLVDGKLVALLMGEYVGSKGLTVEGFISTMMWSDVLFE